eukprot:Skav218698  [mRNA]  locus=scaffold1346:239565:244640:+ [translate_table: standard]
MKGTFLDVTGHDAAVIPPKGSIPGLYDDDLKAIELFCGGFGGWDQGVKSLKKAGMPIRTFFALDRDRKCCEAYGVNHSFEHILMCPEDAKTIVENDDNENTITPVIMCAGINDKWWMSVVSKVAIQVLMFSAPCPPWSNAGGSQGFARPDGMTLAITFMLIALLRPKLWLSENVAAIRAHKQWGLIKELILWSNYRVHWSVNVNLQDVLPQSRERNLMMAVDLFEHEIPRSDFQSWNAVLSMDEFKAYMDPIYLPKDFSSGHLKKSLRDVVKYRLRMETDVMTCILTTYGRPFQLDNSLLRQKGIYGALILEGSSVRKMVLPEIMLLFGIASDTWMPSCDHTAMMMMGNAVAVPHCLIALLNMVHAFRPFWLKDTVAKMFDDLFDSRFRASDMEITTDSEGSWFRLKNHLSTAIDATQPMRTFGQVMMRSNLQKYTLECQQDVCILDALKCMLGLSLPQSLEFRIEHPIEFKIPLTPQMKMPQHLVHLIAQTPSSLELDEKTIHAHDWPIVVVLLPRKTIILKRHPDMCIADVVCAIQSFTIDHPHGMFPLNFLGEVLGEDEPACNMILMGNLPLSNVPWPSGETAFRFQEDHSAFFAEMDVQCIHEFTRLMRSSGLYDCLGAFGWRFTTEIEMAPEQLKKEICLSNVPGKLAVRPQAIMHIFITRVMVRLLDAFSTSDEGAIEIRIKLWNTWIWKGQVAKDTLMMFVTNAWLDASSMFGNETPMRMIVKGRQVMPETAAGNIANLRDGEKISLHLVLAMHGGGGPDFVRPDVRDVHLSDDHMDEVICDEADSQVSSFSISDLLVLPRDQVVDVLLEELMAIPADDRLISKSNFQGSLMLTLPTYFQMTASIQTSMRVLQAFSQCGIERILNMCGWHSVIRFISFTPLDDVLLLILPMPQQPSLGIDLVELFRISAITACTMPHPCPWDFDGPKALISIKLWKTWIVHDHFPVDTICAEFVEPWAVATEFFGQPSQMRIICRGKMINIDYSLQEYVHENVDGDLFARIHMVLQLRGGGKSTQQDPAIQARNELARVLLDSGCELGQTTNFVQKTVHQAGSQAVKQILSLENNDARIDALKCLAVSHAIEFPDFQAAMKKRQVSVKNKLNKQNLKQSWIKAEHFSLKKGHFINEDGSDAAFCDRIQHGATGICLMDPMNACDWVNSDSKISADELAILVLGECPCQDTLRCNRIEVPAIDNLQRPALLSCCKHDMGDKHISVKSSSPVKVDINATAVIAVTLFRDEMESNAWNAVIQAPVKAAVAEMSQLGVQTQFPCPPWGRSWRSGGETVKPSAAMSFQCHMRVLAKDLHSYLKISGVSGLYIVPKSEDKVPDNAFSVVWLDHGIAQLKILAAASEHSLGIVRVCKGKQAKSSWGIRFQKDYFAAAHKKLKPNTEMPIQLDIHHVAKVTPTPAGASLDEVQKWITQNKWKAKAMRQIAVQTWLIGFSSKIDECWADWNGQTILISWMPPRNEKPLNPMVAGTLPKKPKVNPDADSPGDPWASYISQTGASGISPNGRILQNRHTPNAGSTMPPRTIDGPIESRFKQHDDQLAEMKKSLELVQQNLTASDQKHEKSQEQLQGQIKSLDATMKSDVEALSQSFENSLLKAMKQQDMQFTNSFHELKALIAGSVAVQSDATPPDKKKAKPEKGGKEKMQVDQQNQNDDDL